MSIEIYKENGCNLNLDLLIIQHSSCVLCSRRIVPRGGGEIGCRANSYSRSAYLMYGSPGGVDSIVKLNTTRDTKKLLFT